jgi:hypothetical protein
MVLWCNYQRRTGVTELFNVNLLISGFVVGLEPARSFVNVNISEVIAIDQRNSDRVPIPEMPD